MYHRHGDVHKQSQSLRRRRNAQSTEAGPQTPWRGWAQTLDLSVCQPSPSSSNRFSVLATLATSPPSHSKSRDFPVPSVRRVRSSRSTREAKNRRNLRRNSRKLAVQLLDAQLGHQIDKNLSAIVPVSQRQEAEIVPASQEPEPVRCDVQHPEQLAALPPCPSYELSALPPTPPVLSLPQFSGFDIDFFPHLSPPPAELDNVSRSISFPELPGWCPRIPSLTMDDVWRNCLPNFFDLSRLPETPTSATELGSKFCTDILAFQPEPRKIVKKRSRFFPPKNLLTAVEQGLTARSKSRVKLPPTACQLHVTDAGVDTTIVKPTRSSMQYAVTEMISTAPTPSMWDWAEPEPRQQPRVSISTADTAVAATQTTTTTQTHESHGAYLCDWATAANLWHILSSTSPQRTNNDIETAFLASTTPLPRQSESEVQDLDLAVLSRDQLSTSFGPFELENTALPYVHANSLIGYSNQCVAHPCATDSICQPTYHDTCLLMTCDDIPAYTPGLNELLVDTDYLAGTDHLPPHQSEPPQASHGCMAISQFLEIVPPPYDVSADAQRQSQDALFAPSPNAPSPASIPDLANFFTLGHARNCWCSYCDGGILEAQLLRDQGSSCIIHPLGTSELDDHTLVEDEDYDSLATEDGQSGPLQEEDWLLWDSISELITIRDDQQFPRLSSPRSYVPDDSDLEEIKPCVRDEFWEDFYPVLNLVRRATVDSLEEEDWETEWHVQDAEGWEWES